MYIPNYIITAINRCAYYGNIQTNNSNIIRDWLDINGLGENDSVLDQLIDTVENGNNPNAFIEYLKQLNENEKRI